VQQAVFVSVRPQCPVGTAEHPQSAVHSGKVGKNPRAAPRAGNSGRTGTVGSISMPSDETGHCYLSKWTCTICVGRPSLSRNYIGILWPFRMNRQSAGPSALPTPSRLAGPMGRLRILAATGSTAGVRTGRCDEHDQHHGEHAGEYHQRAGSGGAGKRSGGQRAELENPV